MFDFAHHVLPYLLLTITLRGIYNNPYFTDEGTESQVKKPDTRLGSPMRSDFNLEMSFLQSLHSWHSDTLPLQLWKI